MIAKPNENSFPEHSAPTVLVLEDRPDSTEAEELAQILNSFGDKIEWQKAPTPLEFVHLLRGLEEKGRLLPALFIIDIMIGSVTTLKSIGIDNVSSPGGTEIGIYFVYRFLRAIGSKYRDVPILFWSILSSDEAFSSKVVEALKAEAEITQSGANITYVTKDRFGEVDGFDSVDAVNWQDQVKNILLELVED